MEENYKVERDICNDTYDVDAFDNIRLKGEECTKWLNRSLYKIGPRLEIPIIFHTVVPTSSSAIPSVFNCLVFGQGHTNVVFISCLHCSNHETK
jgi:hypothetical protein